MKDVAFDMLKEVIKICNSNNITYYCQAGTVLGVIRHGGAIPWDHDIDIIIPNNEIDHFVECAERELSEKYYVDYYKTNEKAWIEFPRIGMKGFSTSSLHLDVFRLIGLPNKREEQLSMMEQACEAVKIIKKKRRSFLACIYHNDWSSFFEKFKYVFISKKKMYTLFDSVCNKYDYESAQYVMNPSGKYREKNIFRKEIYGEGVIKQFNNIDVRIPSDYDFYLHQYYGDYLKTPSTEYINREMHRVFNIIEEK